MRSRSSSATTRPSSRPRAEGSAVSPDAPATPRAGRWLTASGILALTGATLGAALDAIHVQTATTSYTHPVLFGQAWWVPPLFAAAGVAIGLGRPLAERILGTVRPAPTRAAAVGGVAVFVLAYAVSGLVGRPMLPLAGLFVLAWVVGDRTGLGLLLAALTAIGGTTVEMLLVQAGAFAYREPAIGGVAGWLPVLYCCAAAGVGGLGKWLVDGRAP